MNILVTGAAGFIGTSLVKKLKLLGHNVISIDIQQSDYIVDITNFQSFSVLNKYKFDLIYHLAAQSYGRGSLENPHKDLDWNAVGTLNVCLYAQKQNIKKIIYTSTMAVYGDKNLANELDSLDPKSNYACSKLYGEYCVKRFSEYNINHVIFRVFNTYGPGQDLSNQQKGIVNAFISQLKQGDKINVTGSLDRYRDLIYIDDVINALVYGLNNELNNQIFNICSSKKTYVKELIDLIINVANRKNITIKNIGSHAGDQIGTTGDNTKLKSFGWSPKMSLKEGIYETYNNNW